jgi:hypothetical protein
MDMFGSAEFVQIVQGVQKVLNGAPFESLTALRAIEGRRLNGLNV